MMKQPLPHAPTVAPIAPLVRSRLLERAALAALAIVTLLLVFVNLPYAPRTWFDEGSHLHVPKTLVRHGVYADISAEGFRYYGPTVGVGPTVMLPIAGVFQLFGVGLVQGRLVIAAYALLAFAAFYLLARRLHGPRVALLALAFVLASRTRGFEGIVEYSRQVLGEAPGVAFLLLGCLAWIKALPGTESRSTTGSWFAVLGSGVCFGLALVTKNQFVLIVPPTLALLALLDWRYYRLGSWALRIVPLVIATAFFAAWTFIQLQFLGPGTFMDNLAQTRQAAGGAIFVFDLEATLRAVRYLVQVYGGLLIPALLYGLWRCRRRTPAALAELLPLLMAALWLCWYLISLGWPRYAVPAVVFGALAAARLVADLFTFLRRQPRLRPAAWLVAAYATVAIALMAGLSAHTVLSPDRSAHQIAAYLDANVPQDVIVETWEPELGLLTDHRYHYPPISLLDRAVRHRWLAGASISYNVPADPPPYLVIGPFGADTGIYNSWSQSRYELVQQNGPYALYRLNR